MPAIARRLACIVWRGGGAALMLAGSAAAHAADLALAGSSGASAAAQPREAATSSPDIIVIAPPLFQDIQPERSLDAAAIAGYGVSTIDELLAEIVGELGDDEVPLVVVNGQRIDLSQIGALPVEVVRTLQVLPRGSAVRLGGTSGQRVLAVRTVPRARNATMTLAPRLATEGQWRAGRGEAILTQIRGDTRINLAIRARREDSLLESDRDVRQPDLRRPFAQTGNIIAYPGLSGEIDPLLSAAAGQVVTVVPLQGSASPTLADLAAGANRAAMTDLGDFRTLRPRTRLLEGNATYATRLAPWLTGSATVRAGRTSSLTLRGLPSALFLLPESHPDSPFSRDVALALYGDRPLRSRYHRRGGEGLAELNATLGRWRASASGRYIVGTDISRFDRQSSSGTIGLQSSVNPFSADLAALVPVAADSTRTRSIDKSLQLSATGPGMRLPAGDLVLTLEGRLAGSRLRTKSTFAGSAAQRFHRSEQAVRAAFELPIASRDAGALPALGELSATGEYGRIHFSDAGKVERRAAGLNWEPFPPLRLHADVEATDRPPSIQTLGNPVVIVPSVRMFDPLTGDTVDVTQVSGGNPSLLPETVKVRRLSALLRLVPRLNLQLNAEYVDSDSRNFVSSLPEASAAVMLAFPERFVRDPFGVLTRVDVRPVNFDSHREKRLRYGLSLNSRIGTPLGRVAAGAGAAAEGGGSSGPRNGSRLLLSVSHSLVLSDRIVIRPGLDSVDLLDGGAIGIASGRVRHQVEGTASLTSSGAGVRLGANWRGPSTLEARIGQEAERLRFGSLLILNIRAFVDLERLLGRNAWNRSTRLSLNVVNVAGDRQRVRDRAGNTPLQYQPAYRDGLGRTIELELRKSF